MKRMIILSHDIKNEKNQKTWPGRRTKRYTNTSCGMSGSGNCSHYLLSRLEAVPLAALHAGTHYCTRLDSSSGEREWDLLEKFRVASIVVRMAPFSLRRALNFFRHSTVSCRCRVEATRSRWQIHGCFSAPAAVILFAGFTVSIESIRFFASGVTVSHSGDGYCAGVRQPLVKRGGLKDRTYVISSGFDLCIKPMLVLVPEGRVTHQQDVEDDS